MCCIITCKYTLVITICTSYNPTNICGIAYHMEAIAFMDDASEWDPYNLRTAGKYTFQQEKLLVFLQIISLLFCKIHTADVKNCIH